MQGLRRCLLVVAALCPLLACASAPTIAPQVLSFIGSDAEMIQENKGLRLSGKIILEISSEVDLLEWGDKNNYHTTPFVTTCHTKKILSGAPGLNPSTVNGSGSYSYHVGVDFKADMTVTPYRTGKLPYYDLSRSPEDICLTVKYGGIAKVGRVTNQIVFPLTPDIISSIRQYEQ